MFQMLPGERVNSPGRGQGIGGEPVVSVEVRTEVGWPGPEDSEGVRKHTEVITLGKLGWQERRELGGSWVGQRVSGGPFVLLYCPLFHLTVWMGPRPSPALWAGNPHNTQPSFTLTPTE